MSVVCVAGVTTTCTSVAQLVKVKKAPRNSAKPESLLHGGNGNQDGKNVHKVGWVTALMTIRMSRLQVELSVSGGEMR